MSADAASPAEAIQLVASDTKTIYDLWTKEAAQWGAPSQRWVCYLDMLGFAELQSRIQPGTSPQLVGARRRVAALRELLELDEQATVWSSLEPLSDPYHDIKVTSCSDSVFVSAADNVSGFHAVATFAGEYTFRAMTGAGLLVRGAIAFGHVVHTGSVIMGNAVVEAVRREQSIGDPVVSICDSAVSRLQPLTRYRPLLRREKGDWRMDLSSWVTDLHAHWADPVDPDPELMKATWTRDDYLRPIRRALAAMQAQTLAKDAGIRRKVRYAIGRLNQLSTRGPLRRLVRPIALVDS